MNFTLKIFLSVFILFDVNDVSQISTMIDAQGIHSPLTLIRKQEQYYIFPYSLRMNSDDEIDYSLNDDEQVVHFCPASEPWQTKRAQEYIDGQCLFKNSGANHKCENSAEPVINLIDDERKSDICANTRHTAYAYGYRLCFSDQSEKVNQSTAEDYLQILYTFCYDRVTRTMAYLSYHILSPNLLVIDSLQRHERDTVNADLRTDVDDKNSLEAYIQQISSFYLFQDDLKQKVPPKNQTFDNRRLTMLAPVDDLAFALWKKPFFHLLNHGILFHHLIEQWYNINQFLRTIAIERASALRIVVGKLDETIGLADTWCKIVFNQNETHAMGILLRNYSSKRTVIQRLDIDCSIRCADYGFQDMILAETDAYVSCCKPQILARKIGLQVSDSLEILDLSEE